jgi:hypothetical protein
MSLEFLEFLNRINDNISEIKERLIRIEAQDLSSRIAALQISVEVERVHRQTLEIKVAELKTKLAPLLVGVAIIGAGIVNIVIQLVP